MKTLMSIVIGAGLLTACSNTVSESVAKDLIDENWGEGVHYFLFEEFGRYDTKTFGGSAKPASFFEILEKADELAYLEVEIFDGDFDGKAYRIKGSNTAIPEIGHFKSGPSRIALYTWKPGEILGIKSSGGDCDAEVEFKWDRYPIGSLGEYYIERFERPSEVVCLTRYDSGWKISEEQRVKKSSLPKSLWWTEVYSED